MLCDWWDDALTPASWHSSDTERTPRGVAVRGCVGGMSWQLKPAPRVNFGSGARSRLRQSLQWVPSSPPPSHNFDDPRRAA